MSELKQSFTKAIQTFTHASDLLSHYMRRMPDRGGYQGPSKIPRGRSFWQTDRKRCPAIRFAIDLDPTTVGLDNLPGDR